MKRTSWFVLGGLLVALLLAGVVSNFASDSPDGLDSASTRGCTVDAAGEITGGSCMARNAKENETAGSPFAGVVGVLLTFAVGGGLFRLVRRKRPAETRE